MEPKVYMNNDFQHFFVTNYPRIKSFARKILLSEEDAEDVAQDIFLKLIDLPEIWQDEENNVKILFTMTRNHIFNLIKRRTFERTYHESLYERYKVLEEFGLEQELYAKELKLTIAYIIEKMPEQRQKIFKMSRIEGNSNAEIAKKLNLSIRTVERHIYLALSELRKKIFLLLF